MAHREIILSPTLSLFLSYSKTLSALTPRADDSVHFNVFVVNWPGNQNTKVINHASIEEFNHFFFSLTILTSYLSALDFCIPPV